MSEKQIDVMGHIFVPKHSKVSEDELKTVLETLNISKKQMPKISKKDPSIQNLGELNPGDVIRIERKSPTAGITIFYRTVK